MRNFIIKIAIVIVIACIAVVYLNHKKSDEEHQKLIKERNEALSSVLSKDKGKYYLVALGISENTQTQFMSLCGQIISGCYANPNPSKKEIRDFNVHETPIYMVFDTKKEIFHTNDLFKLKTFLTKLANENKN